MAKKDDKERLLIPEDILSLVPWLNDYSKEQNLAFGLDNSGKVFLDHTIRIMSTNSEFLGYCNYDSENHTIDIPTNVDCVLGKSTDYYFSIKFDMKRNFLYINKEPSISHIEKNINN